MKRFLNWLADKISPQEASQKITRNRPGYRDNLPQNSTPKRTIPARPAPKPDVVEFDAHVNGKIDDAGPGKNVLRRSKFIREDSGTHDTLSIVGEPLPEENTDIEGIDPYNTGQFDRSKNWDKRFRKD